MVVSSNETSRSLAVDDMIDDFDSFRPLVEGRVAIVTGATRGIGRALALYYAKLGAAVAVDGRDEALVRELVEDAAGLSGPIVGVPGDIREDNHRKELLERAERALGPVDILVNNAGVIQEGRLVHVTPEQWQNVVAVNLDAVFAMTQLVGARCMLPRRSGKVLNLSSILGTTAIRGHGSYCASKGGVEQLTRSFAVEWAASGVHVNAIAPGYVKTRMNQRRRDDPRVRQALLATIPAERFGELEDVVGPALFLTTSLSDYCHGTILAVDGGYLCR
jgi:NAD(P)-dependent dehydrogenase (short-subunit alcohol dehydrogenase family)